MKAQFRQLTGRSSLVMAAFLCVMSWMFLLVYLDLKLFLAYREFLMVS